MIKIEFNNNIGITYFYDLFKKRNKKYPLGYFFTLKTKSKKVTVSRKLYLNIISKYFESYFDDFYNTTEPIYFPLSGKLVKTKSRSFTNIRGKIKREPTITWTWFLRPYLNYVSNIKIMKGVGSTGKIYKLDKKLKEGDLEYLPYFKKTIRELNKSKKLYK